jgi:hypothetical protein
LKGPSGAGLVQHRIDRGFARSIHAVSLMRKAVLEALAVRI